MIIPMSLRNISEYLATVSICFIKFVNIPANTKITPSPNANINSIRSEINMLFVIAAKLIIPARIGVEQGVPPIAKSAPSSIGYKYFELFEFEGILEISVGRFISKSPKRCRPIAKRSEAIKIRKYPPAIEINTLPVTAQSIPIMLNTIAEPMTNDVSWRRVFLLSFSLNPPM